MQQELVKHQLVAPDFEQKQRKSIMLQEIVKNTILEENLEKPVRELDPQMKKETEHKHDMLKELVQSKAEDN